MKKVIISMPWAPDIVSELDEYIKLLEDKGLHVILDPKQKRLTESELIEKWPDVYAHICGADAMTAKAINSADKLKIISRIGVGYDTVDMSTATAKGVAVAITPGAGAESVAEYAFALMICLSRKVLQADREVRKGVWDRVPGPSLFRKKIGIIGLGNIGKKLASLTKSFDMKVLAFDFVQDEKYAHENNIEYCALDELLKQADYVSVNVPLTDTTKNFITAKELKLMKPQALIINAARGGIINENDLYVALKDGVIAGAALDVFEQEPVDQSNPLLTLDNVIVSPHNAGSSSEGKNMVVRAAVQNVIDIAEGKIPAGVLNPEVLQKK